MCTSSDSPRKLRDPASGSGWHESFVDRVQAADRLLVATDFDGTIAGIRDRPDAATIDPGARDALAALAGRPGVAVAVVSGRALADVRGRVGLDGIWYAGNHGLEIERGGRRFVHPEAEDAADTIELACDALRDRLADVDGLLVEEKGLTATVHYRLVDDERTVERIHDAVRDVVDRAGGAVCASEGKRIVELRPDVDWDKGRAIEWLLEEATPPDRPVRPVYLGDDLTDEAAFEAIGADGLTVHVGTEPSDTAAEYVLASPGEAADLLAWLAEVVDG